MKFRRREFIQGGAMAFAAGLLGLPSGLMSCTSNSSADDKLDVVSIPEIIEQAIDGRPLKAVLVGCGGRGTGAAVDFITSGKGLTVVGLADIFQDKLDACRKKLIEEYNQDIPLDNCFLGFDAYRKVIELDVDVVLLCTPPVFRPQEFEYAVERNRHIFAEKPCAVDPVGVRRILVASKRAEMKKLCVMSGMIRRWQKDVLETYRRVSSGMMGEIVSAHATRFGGELWYKKRQPEWNDMEYMMRNWVSFCWTSGDFPVEQFVHELDMVSWFMGNKLPVSVQSTGGRQKRISGDLYDFFSFEFLFENGIRAHCTSRQIGGCDKEHSVMVYGTKGYTNCFNTIYNLDGTVAWKYEYPKEGDANQLNAVPNPFRQEHIQLISAIRSNKYINDTDKQASCTLMAIMGRESAYTGKFVTWDQIKSSNLKLGPDSYEFGAVPGVVETPPVIGDFRKV